ncbi:ADP-ribosylglycohydrolase family protein [Microbacterium mitrae]|uniref:ADP-ribosylglycohydrolase family protein n=1 Tax=Microbacterium mitrae TaxID=664640 RepID=A0A5C8HPB6_9MICO|nr:ADP-ribosylglycohydrolase family protein [Microbacterium mitrae]TXK04634.1 ADP-ribosylglycohydrolase family protein [Microbacterium mitrae]
MRLTWAQPEDLLPHELVQARVEGKSVDAVAERWQQAGGTMTPEVSGAGTDPAMAALRPLARQLLDELDEQPAAIDAAEPETWNDIVATLTPAAVRPVPTDLRDRVHGAWAGRAAGCLLGKPVEKIPRQGIEEILRATDRWPLNDWFTAQGLPAEVNERWPWNKRSAPTSLAENIDGMPEDDDLNYPLLALTLLEAKGREFTTEDVAQLWLDALPAGRSFTAERAAYRNILDARPVPQTATHHNPFREWIGALIRTDVFGWVSPGDVLTAAHLAYEDARLSHTRNGVYGAMWAAALGAAALTAGTVAEALDDAGTIVPPQSRLAEAIAFGRALGADGDISEDGVRGALDALHAKYGELHWVHTLNNAAVIAYALQVGRGDFAASISIAVTAGWDTDSAGATVGAVVGAVRGFEGIESRWTSPLRNTIATSLPGGDQQISRLVERTLALISPAH